MSAGTISTITDEVLDEVKAWQHRPPDEVYPIIYVDALMVKVRDGGQVRNKACYLVVAKYWAQVCTELRNRGVRAVLIACCDGLTSLPEGDIAALDARIARTPRPGRN